MTTEPHFDPGYPINLDDIRKAIKTVKECSTVRRIEYEYGWIDVDSSGNIRTIGLNEKGRKEVMKMFGYQKELPDDINITEFDGIKVVVDDR